MFQNVLLCSLHVDLYQAAAFKPKLGFAFAFCSIVFHILDKIGIRVMDLESEIQEFNTHWGSILSLNFLVFYVVKLLMPILSLLPMLCVCEKL